MKSFPTGLNSVDKIKFEQSFDKPSLLYITLFQCLFYWLELTSLSPLPSTPSTSPKYSVIFHVWNILWWPYSKSNKDNWILKKVSKSWCWCILWCLSPRSFFTKINIFWQVTKYWSKSAKNTIILGFWLNSFSLSCSFL